MVSSERGAAHAQVDDAAPDSTGMVVAEPAAAADPHQADGDQLPDAQPSGATVAGGAADVDADDDAAVCSALFRGLVFFLGCGTKVAHHNDAVVCFVDTETVCTQGQDSRAPRAASVLLETDC